MDMRETIKRKPKGVKKEAKQPEPKTLYKVHLTLVEKPSDSEDKHYNLTGEVVAKDMDTDLLSSVLATILKKSVPEDAIVEVLNETADKLGYTSVNKEIEELKQNSRNALEGSLIKLLKLLGE